MLTLTFFTSNQTKLAHAKYLSEGIPINIQGFREKTYHAGYDEPRILDRAELLDRSYRSALIQAGKARILPSKNFFFLEDTSVRINALSNYDSDVPGVDIKYWMQKTSFDDLDSLLRQKNNDRNVVVRSDILLHLPEEFKTRNGIVEDYLIFTGEQRGCIVQNEGVFETNLVYPWLDNQSFNKWFLPQGAKNVLGRLPIQEADKFDFRRFAFEKMVAFLDAYNLVEKKVQQAQLPLEIPVIITGFSCAGKTEASQYLAEKHQYLHIEASDFMYLSYYSRHGYRSEVSIGDFAEQALKDKPHIVAEKIARYLEEFPGKPVIISGFRAPDEIAWLENYLSLSSVKLRPIFVKAAQHIRFDRLEVRRRRGDNICFEEFSERDEQQSRMGLHNIQTGEATHVILNEEDLNSYYDDISSYLSLCPSVGRSADWDPKAGLLNIKNIKLEDAILISLFTVWVKSEGGDYYTTADIAKLIEIAFPKVVPPKHKDNISRYFNQDFRPYYEIDGSESDQKRRYRLSNTGYGKALSLLHEMNL